MIHQRVVLPFRGTYTGWTTGPKGTSWSSAKGNDKSCLWESITNPVHQCGLRSDCLESRSAEKDLEVLVDSKLNMSQQHALPAKWTNGTLGYIRQSAAHWCDSSRESWIQCWTHQYKRNVDLLEHIGTRATELMKRQELKKG